MSPTDPPDARSDYHHGDVARAGVAAGLALLEEKGEREVTMRGVAERVGVAHRALYAPFGGREGLLDALAAAGLAALAEAVGEASDRESFVRAYLRFATDRFALYDLAMRRARTAAAEAAALVERTRAALDASDDEIKRVWMTLHGGLTLRAGGVLAERDERRFADMMTEMTR